MFLWNQWVLPSIFPVRSKRCSAMLRKSRTLQPVSFWRTDWNIFEQLGYRILSDPPIQSGRIFLSILNHLNTIYSKYMGVSIHGVYPKNGWSISWKLQSRNGWWTGVPPWRAGNTNNKIIAGPFKFKVSGRTWPCNLGTSAKAPHRCSLDQSVILWVNYNISLTSKIRLVRQLTQMTGLVDVSWDNGEKVDHWDNSPKLGSFPLLAMIPVRSQWGHLTFVARNILPKMVIAIGGHPKKKVDWSTWVHIL